MYGLELPNLQLLWLKRLDFATCFGIYEYEDDLIVHGAVDITRISADGAIKWQFSGADIFVTFNGKLAFDIVGGEIKLVDFHGTRYILKGTGETMP
jgi:hypothetical protein